MIIFPLSTLENWKNKINIHFGTNSLPFKVYYGKEKSEIAFKHISQVAVVLATYQSVLMASRGGNSEVEGGSKELTGRSMGLDLTNIEWFRIVLNEAQ